MNHMTTAERLASEMAADKKSRGEIRMWGFFLLFVMPPVGLVLIGLSFVKG